MNPYQLKADIYRKANVICQGQVVAHFSNEDLFDAKRIHISPGFYTISDVSIMKTGAQSAYKSPFVYSFHMSAVDWNSEQSLWQPKPEFYQVKMDQLDLYRFFGIKTPAVGAIALKPMIEPLIKDAFQKAGRIHDFDQKYDYDKVFGGIAENCFRKNPFKINDEDKKDMIQDAIMQVINPKTLKSYDPQKDIVKYFGGMFRYRLLDELSAFTQRHTTETSNPSKEDDFSDEERMDYKRNLHGPADTSVEDQLELKSLIKDLSSFIQKQPQSEWLMKVFQGLFKGYSNKELAEQYNVSPASITKYLQVLQTVILAYAKKTDNNLLFSLMTEMSKTKKHADDEHSFMIDVFKKYKLKHRQLTPEQ